MIRNKLPIDGDFHLIQHTFPSFICLLARIPLPIPNFDV